MPNWQGSQQRSRPDPATLWCDPDPAQAPVQLAAKAGGIVQRDATGRARPAAERQRAGMVIASAAAGLNKGFRRGGRTLSDRGLKAESCGTLSWRSAQLQAAAQLP